MNLKQNIFRYWLAWHFIEIPRDIIKIINNLLRFVWSFFSISLLLKTLFSPWRKYYWGYGRGFSLKNYLSAFSFNCISRFLGMLVRIGLIFIFLIAIFLVSGGGLILFLAWIFSPVIIIFFLILAGVLIF